MGCGVWGARFWLAGGSFRFFRLLRFRVALDVVVLRSFLSWFGDRAS